MNGSLTTAQSDQLFCRGGARSIGRFRRRSWLESAPSCQAPGCCVIFPCNIYTLNSPAYMSSRSCPRNGQWAPRSPVTVRRARRVASSGCALYAGQDAVSSPAQAGKTPPKPRVRVSLRAFSAQGRSEPRTGAYAAINRRLVPACRGHIGRLAQPVASTWEAQHPL